MPDFQTLPQKKATKLFEIPDATYKEILVSPGDPFYVDLSSLRAENNQNFDNRLRSLLRINANYKFQGEPSFRSMRLSIMGFRGCGKTTFLNTVCKRLKEGGDYFPVFCDVQKELSDNPQAIDFILLQVKRLLEEINDTKDIEKKLHKEGAAVLTDWMSSKWEVVTDKTSADTAVRGEASTGIGIGALLKIAASLTTGVSVSSEKTDTIRREFINSYADFALKINEFFEMVNEALQKSNNGKKIIFIVDGIEKLDGDHRLISDIQEKYEKLRVDVVFSFPIEATFERDRFQDFNPILFPFLRVKNCHGELLPNAIQVFTELLEKRVDRALFASKEVQRRLIEFSGGSVRQLFTLLEESSYQVVDRENGIIDTETVEKAIRQRATLFIRNISPEVWKKFSEIEHGAKSLREGKAVQISVDEALTEMVIKNLVFDYNDGTAYEVNPVISHSPVYRTKVSEQ